MSFKIGQKIVKAYNSDPFHPQHDPKAIEPSMGQVVTVNATDVDEYGEWVGLEEMSQYVFYWAKDFEPLSDISSELSEEIMEKVLTTIEEPIEVS